jgi:hypothetical protein
MAGSQKDPIARVVRIQEMRGKRTLTVRCPFCGKEHLHAAGAVSDSLDKFLGHRLSQCYGRDRRQYRLVVEKN